MADCKACKELRAEEQKQLEGQKDVSYIVYETAMARNERTVKRLITALIVAVLMIVASNAAWLWYISLYDIVSYEVNSTDGGNANYIGNDGDIYNGIGESEEKNAEETQELQRDNGSEA